MTEQHAMWVTIDVLACACIVTMLTGGAIAGGRVIFITTTFCASDL